MQIPTHLGEDGFWVFDQLSRHRPVQPQRAFLITRQFALMHRPEKAIQLEPRDATM